MPVDARRRETHLAAAVVVERRALDDGVDGIAIGQRIVKPAQHDDTDAIAEHGPLGVAIERAAMPIGRCDHAFLPQIATPLWQRDRDPARQGHVALVTEQALYGRTNRDQGGRASRLDIERRALQIQLVGNPGRQVILLVAHHRREPADDVGHIPTVEQVLQVVVVVAGAREHADGPAELLRVVTRILQCLPCRFQEHALLRIEYFRFLRVDAEEARVEHFNAVENPARSHVGRTGTRRHVVSRRGLQLVGAEVGDRLPGFQ